MHTRNYMFKFQILNLKNCLLHEWRESGISYFTNYCINGHVWLFEFQKKLPLLLPWYMPPFIQELGLSSYKMLMQLSLIWANLNRANSCTDQACSASLMATLISYKSEVVWLQRIATCLCKKKTEDVTYNTLMGLYAIFLYLSLALTLYSI